MSTTRARRPSPKDQNLSDRIAFVGPHLTPTERRLAQIVLADPTAVAFGTVADLARAADTSGPSVVRFATKLDFDGYGEMQEHVRSSLSERLRRPTDRIRLTSESSASGSDADQGRAAGTAADLIDQVNRAMTTIDDETLTTVATTLAAAPGTVWVLCAETSATPGVLLAGNLHLLRPGVRHLGGPPSLVASQLAEAGPDDVAVVIDFPRYEAAIVAAAGELSAAGTTIVAITDGPLSPLAGLADTWWGVDVHAVGPFDSVLPVVAVVEVIIAETATLLRNQATDRLDRIERLWTDSRVFDQGTPP